MSNKLLILCLACTICSSCRKFTIDRDAAEQAFLKRATLEELNTFIASNSQHPDAYSRRGDIYAKQEKTALAMADYNRAIELDPENWQPYLMRGIIHYATTLDLAAAEANFDRAIR